MGDVPNRIQGHLLCELPSCILVNGPSSAGKTSLVRALQDSLPILILGFGVDAVLYSLPPADLTAMKAGNKIERAGYSYDLLVDAHHAAIRGILEAGCRVFVDTGLLRARHRASFDAAVNGFRTFRIGVTCALDELDRRERERGDRAAGSARREADIVHQGMSYDLLVDTTDTSLEIELKQVFHALNLWCAERARDSGSCETGLFAGQDHNGSSGA